MFGIKSFKYLWRIAIVLGLLTGGGIRLVIAGPDEDYAAGMVSYQQGDFATAIGPLRKAADGGHVEAQVVLGEILDVTEADEEAVKYFRKAADAGNLKGVFGLATMYSSGDGIKRDVEQARLLFVKAAEGGHKQAILVVAQAYIRGELGISEDQRNGEEALKWITLAAEQEFLVAMEVLEKAYRSGGYGLAPDIGKADELKKKINKNAGVKEKKSRRRGESK